MIGGTTTSARNVITDVISLGTNGTTAASGKFVQGNFIGIDVTGTVVLGCTLGCIRILDQNNTIGGSAPGAGNRIGGITHAARRNPGPGLGHGHPGQLHRHGRDGHGPHSEPRLRDPGHLFASGTVHDIQIGGTQPGEGNVIAYNGATGAIVVEGHTGNTSPTGITIRGNSIFDNPGSPRPTGSASISSSTARPEVTFNDAGDGDSGPNGFQNYPILSSVTYGASTRRSTGTLNSTPSTTFDLDFYA